MTLEDLYLLLCSGHVQSQGIVDTIGTPLVVLDGEFVIVGGNKPFFEMFKLDAAAAMDRSLFEIGNGQWNIPELRMLMDNVIPKSTAIVGYELRTSVPGKGERALLLNVRRLVHPENKSTSMLVEIEDVTERRQQLASKEILLEETRHRMRNLLAVVRSLANQTRMEGRTAEEYRTALLGRLETVLEAQELGGGATTDLNTLVRKALAQAEPARIKLEPGPQVQLAGPQVMPINLILHELATNALKYGALSAPDGMVHVGWKVVDGSNDGGDGEDGRMLHLVWREEGGPPVAVPARHGFGSKLIEFSARSDLGGKAELDFTPQGLCARIEARLE